MLEVLQNLFMPIAFIPHGHCYLWNPGLVWLHVLSDSCIAIAYYSIPVVILYFVHKRQDLPFSWIFLLFGAFIVACGTTHVMEIWTLWHPIYWVSGLLKAITAIISLYTALTLVPLVPLALALPSPESLKKINLELEQEITERKKMEEALRTLSQQERLKATQLEITLEELTRTQSLLIHNEKMVSLGQLVAGVAHEINNPVSFIHGNITYAQTYTQNLLDLIKLYQQYYPNSVAEIQQQIEYINLDFIAEDFFKLLVSMASGANRISQIVLSLRNFSRLGEEALKKADIHEGIDSTLLMLQHRLQQHKSGEIQVIKDYGDIPLIECYPSQLNQVFMNVLSNAIDALDEMKTKEIDFDRQVQVVQPRLQIFTCIKKDKTKSHYLQEQDYVVINITDNGCGIKPSIQSKIFDPFFTTKSPGKGTGLGLSISYQIVINQHNGKLWCHSDSHQGTTFFIELPVTQNSDQ
ncbi:ATPase [Scytonema hofmannii PCC 7110]|uniref:histidine kinase n=2 Tax=Scytonema hofmannii TaxID=34078 RepID=A0A139X0N7_9CYAN|nr:ATP-binding protein [Scytonema hofmannii]KYC38226.1 ATPase [Scytonema hofmannii PCC 7110]